MYYFIVNPKSSSGQGAKIWQTIEPVLKTQNISYEVFFTESGLNASELAHDISLSQSPATIIAVGGDGTINDVVNGLTNFSSITFSYIPTGSANDFGRGLKLEKDPLKRLHSILHPTTIIPLSVGSLETPNFSRRFAVSSGIGFDAAVCAGTQESRLKKLLNRLHLGKLCYTGIALKQIAMMKPSSMTLTLDNKRPIHFPAFYFAAAMNLPYEGGGFKFAPQTDATDDVLDMVLLSKIPKLKILCILPTAFFGKHTRFKGIHMYRFKKAVLEIKEPLYLHTDGEVPGKVSQLTWQILPEKVPFILN